MTKKKKNKASRKDKPEDNKELEELQSSETAEEQRIRKNGREGGKIIKRSEPASGKEKIARSENATALRTGRLLQMRHNTASVKLPVMVFLLPAQAVNDIIPHVGNEWTGHLLLL